MILKDKIENKEEKKVIGCACCKSTKIMRFNLNPKWFKSVELAIGNYHTVNSKEHYSKEELKLSALDVPELDVYHCLNCGAVFNTPVENKSTKLLDISKYLKEV